MFWLADLRLALGLPGGIAPYAALALAIVLVVISNWGGLRV